jgi:stearoyl-CoA desaturase (delta-9 desaturase)
MAHADRLYASVPEDERVRPLEELPLWSAPEVLRRHGQKIDTHRRILLLVEGCIVDVGRYIEEHPGGAQLLLNHAVKPLSNESESDDDTPLSSRASSTALEATPASSGHDSGYFSEPLGDIQLKDATRAFFGGMNNHSGAAKEKMRCLRVARLER